MLNEKIEKFQDLLDQIEVDWAEDNNSYINANTINIDDTKVSIVLDIVRDSYNNYLSIREKFQCLSITCTISSLINDDIYDIIYHIIKEFGLFGIFHSELKEYVDIHSSKLKDTYIGINKNGIQEIIVNNI